jgi:DNA-binding beta-propeller fold protein YncE
VDRRAFLVAAASLPFAASRSRAGALGGTPVALVTADLQSSVIVVELASGRVLRRLRTMAGPRSIESVDGTTAVVAHTTSGALSIVDGASLRVRHVVEGFREPRYTAIAPDGRHAYVSDSGRGDVAVVDIVRGIVLDRLDLDGPARHISLSPSGRQLWVSLGSKAELVAQVEVRERRRLRLVRHVRPPFLAHDVGFAPEGGDVWVTSGDRESIAVFDARTRRVRFRIAADAPPQHVTFIRSRAYVASGDDGTLRVLDAANGRVLRKARVPVGSYNVQQGWGIVMTPSLDRGTLCVVARDGQLMHRVDVARSSHDACFVMSR